MGQPRRPWFAAPWDGRSDQPLVLRDRALKRRLRLQAWPEHLRVAATALTVGPLIATRLLWPGLRLRRPQQWRDFLGVGVSPHPQILDLVAELGARKLLLRCPPRPGPEQDAALALVAAAPEREWLLVVAQDRQAVCRPAAWAADLCALARKLPPQVRALQLGNAINRMKWGCATVAEYLDVVEAAHDGLRQARPNLMLFGSSVIDFEPHLTLRSLINGYHHRFDGVSAQLYVDRRGGPDGRQYGIFDTRRKIATVAALVASAPRHGKRLWITEVNWPLRGYPGWAPTSDHECVDEEAAACYLEMYCRQAWQSRCVERVYPWQLIARGYGLVDDSGPHLRQRPAFRVVQSLLQQPAEPV